MALLCWCERYVITRVPVVNEAVFHLVSSGSFRTCWAFVIRRLWFGSGACTMMVVEQIQSYRISLELTKPNQSGFIATMKLIISFLCQLRLWSWVCGACAHECVTSAANSQSHASQHRASVIHFSREPARSKTLLLKVKRLKNVRNLHWRKYLSMKEDKFCSISAVYIVDNI